MSMFLTGLSGFAATLAIAAGAIYVTEAKPRAEWRGGSGSSWTGEASAASAQPLKRVAAKPSFKPSTVVKHPEVSPVDRITTGALPDQNSETAPEPDVATTMAHVQWCSERYRSYRLENNSYRSYSGSQRECVSPFTSGSSTREEEEVDHADIGIDRPHGRYAVEEGPANFLTPRHIASCFARYRSYNPDDNSYQPYGGGSRRQCG
ncbi:BA14K family protein [Mesorhizobium sp. CN2-181]|uniref:BA14K family protein n=1 Tax=Mesorhizobium yinganensis TaxID=3157707 RepID=UPI0032B74CA7